MTAAGSRVMRFALLGKKLGYSYSQIIHNAIFDICRIDASYELLEIPEDKIDKFFLSGEYKNYDGLNVTIPYKTVPLKYCSLTEEVKNIGAANTIDTKNNTAYNTDHSGFIKTLESCVSEIKGKKACILGGGGAAKACEYALRSNGAEVIKILRSETIPGEKFDILINATPVGMFPDIDDCRVTQADIEKFDVVIDLIYNPPETKLLKMAEDMGKITQNGLTMLIYQAIFANEIWQGKKLNIADEVIEIIKKKYVSGSAWKPTPTI